MWDCICLKGRQLGKLEVSLPLFIYLLVDSPTPIKTSLLRCLPPSVSGLTP